jgi:hypothetical protein
MGFNSGLKGLSSYLLGLGLLFLSHSAILVVRQRQEVISDIFYCSVVSCMCFVLKSMFYYSLLVSRNFFF